LNELYGKLSKGPSKDTEAPRVFSMDQKALAAMIGTSSKQERKDKMIYTYRRLLERLLQLPWFRRVWVYQEAVLAQRVIAVWGAVVIPFDFITCLIFSVYGLAKFSSDDRKWHERIKDSPGFAPLRAIYYDREVHREGKLDFLHVLWHARKHLSAKDNRDFVYAFRSVNKHIGNIDALLNTSLQDKMVPDYRTSSTADVYTDLALTANRTTKTLDILHFIVPTNPKQELELKPKNQDTSSLPSWVPDWSNRNFTCGTPIFDPQITWPTSACDSNPWIPRPMPNQNELHVSGYIISRVKTILHHSFKHTYFSSTLKKAIGLDHLVTLLTNKAHKLSQAPEWSSEPKIRETALCTALANGAFTLNHKLDFPLSRLLKAYDNEPPHTQDPPQPQSRDGEAEPSSTSTEPDVPVPSNISTPEEEQEDQKLRYYLRQSGEMATGKRVFLTEGLDIGLGYATVKKGDVICILMGCKAPCVLRRKESEEQHGRYVFVGLCYLDGWMDGVAERNQMRFQVGDLHEMWLV
jgi:hypothetical protein